MGWDLVRRAQASSPALRTARDVLAGQAQEELLPVFTWERRRGFRSDVEQLAAEGDPLLPDGIGEQPVVADADEAGREHVEQEAVQERLGGGGPRLLAGARRAGPFEGRPPGHPPPRRGVRWGVR